jgi:diketogulonate reductase-like aldo/keto reductase
MEAIHDSSKARILGVSNVAVEQLQQLYDGARAKPRFVQNRCYASRGWDRSVRQFCAANGVAYQGFSLLTANRSTLAHPELVRLAKRHGRTTSQIVFRFALEIGILPLTGTTSREHMQEDLAAFDFGLEPKETELIEHLG